MQATQLTIDGFRGIRKATPQFSGHTLLIGGNNVGKSTIREALDLVLGPDRLNRTPPVARASSSDLPMPGRRLSTQATQGARRMIAVIFEVEPHPERKDDYLAEAARIKPILEAMDGFISVERFQSLTNPGRIVSLSFWRDEEAVRAWRNQEAHRETQHKGREGIFRDYRLRVAAVLRDYGMDERDQAPADSRAEHGE